MANAFVNEVDGLKSHQLRFCLHPPSWNGFQFPSTLDWDWVKFEEADSADLPPTRGIYAFVVDPDIANVFQHGFPMYVGETGNGNDRTLRKRFGEYVRNQDKICDRHGIHYMLNKWGSHMYFYYVEIPDRRRNLKKLEAILNDALKPPYSVRDFSAEVRAGVRISRL
jgi:hypothetical protein